MKAKYVYNFDKGNKEMNHYKDMLKKILNYVYV